ncbi:MAG: hypothetical protein HKO05_05360, partial [Erythrobacter sp.]|nr:hypothetical protein [Erythrobacter sp.]
MNMDSPKEFHVRAKEAERAGDPAHAKTIIEQGLAAHPGNADLLNSAGNFALKRGEPAV